MRFRTAEDDEGWMNWTTLPLPMSKLFQSRMIFGTSWLMVSVLPTPPALAIVEKVALWL